MGGISRSGKTSLYIHKNKVNAEEYLKCLNESLLPFAQEEYPDGFVLLQDWAPSHTAKKAKDLLNTNEVEVKNNSPWPPDFNPIELIWGIMKKQFNRAILSGEINIYSSRNK